MTDCIFCAIAAGDVPCAELLETDGAFAFLDIHPLRPGHALVVPKEHARRHADMDAAARQAVWDAVAILTPALVAAVGAEDATIAVNDGPAAGQEVPHCHVHIVPRTGNDGAGPVHGLFRSRPDMDSEAIHDVAVRVQQRLAAQDARRGAQATGAGGAA